MSDARYKHLQSLASVAFIFTSMSAKTMENTIVSSFGGSVFHLGFAIRTFLLVDFGFVEIIICIGQFIDIRNPESNPTCECLVFVAV